MQKAEELNHVVRCNIAGELGYLLQAWEDDLAEDDHEQRELATTLSNLIAKASVPENDIEADRALEEAARLMEQHTIITPLELRNIRGEA